MQLMDIGIMKVVCVFVVVMQRCGVNVFRMEGDCVCVACHIGVGTVGA
jgi:hypothetical protein